MVAFSCPSNMHFLFSHSFSLTLTFDLSSLFTSLVSHITWLSPDWFILLWCLICTQSHVILLSIKVSSVPSFFVWGCVFLLSLVYLSFVGEFRLFLMQHVRWLILVYKFPRLINTLQLVAAVFLCLIQIISDQFRHVVLSYFCCCLPVPCFCFHPPSASLVLISKLYHHTSSSSTPPHRSSTIILVSHQLIIKCSSPYFINWDILVVLQGSPFFINVGYADFSWIVDVQDSFSPLEYQSYCTTCGLPR